jgi:hypothetical protein
VTNNDPVSPRVAVLMQVHRAADIIHLLWVFENRVLRIFGPKRDELTGEWRKLHNGEQCDLYSLPSIIRIIKSRRIRWEGHVARMGEKRKAYRLLVGKRPLGRPII